MCKGLLITIVVVLGTMQAARAESEMRVTPPDEPIFNDHDPEPKEIKQFAAAPRRVFATKVLWTGGYTYRTVYFRGDAAALNRLLSLYSSLQAVPSHKDSGHVLICDDGAETRGKLGQCYRESVPVFDWSVRVDSHIQIGGPDRGKLVEASVFVDVWASDRMPLTDLKIPPNLRVKAVSRIEQFADLHEANRLGGRKAMLRQRIRDLQDELARLERHRPATQPAV